MPAPSRARAPRKRFDPTSREPFRVSRSKIDLFLECPRCFYLEARLGISRPSMPGFALNMAVDHLLKKEFDVYRAQQAAHPLMKAYGVEAVPFVHPGLEAWRNTFRGVEVLHRPTNLLVFGAVDDVWINPKKELHVVDYKATSKNGKIDLEGGWGPQYKRQLEVYQWLLRGNGFAVSDVGYFVYANGIKSRESFDNRLEFDVEIIAHTGSDAWVDGVVRDIHRCLVDERVPSRGKRCEYCPYREAAGKELQARHRTTKATRRPQSANKHSTPRLF